MRVTFTSAEPCALRLGGIFAGFCSRHEKFADLSPADKIAAEFFPEAPDREPLSLLLDEALFSAPPEPCRVYRYEGGAHVHVAGFSGRRRGIQTLSQVKACGALCTLYADGLLQANIQSKSGFFTAPLPECVRTARFLPLSACGKDWIALEGQTDGEDLYLRLFDDTTPLFEEFVLSYEGGNRLKTRRAFRDIAGHISESEWEIQDGLRLALYRVREKDGFDAEKLDARLVPLAFFQTVLAKGDFRKYLSPALLPRAESIGQYLGDFTDVCIPPSVFYLLLGETNAAGLVYPSGERLFDVRFFAAPLEDGKIANLLPLGE